VRSVRVFLHVPCKAIAKSSKARDKRCHNESGVKIAVKKKEDEAATICTRFLRNEQRGDGEGAGRYVAMIEVEGVRRNASERTRKSRSQLIPKTPAQDHTQFLYHSTFRP
jgi:hypothetical protein